MPAAKSAAKSKGSSFDPFDLSPDHVDAVLRDPNVPDDVRATVAATYNVQRYLDGVDFEDTGDGYLEVRPAAVDSTAEEVQE